MNKQEILELIKDAKELGLKSIEIDGIKVEFNEAPIHKTQPVSDENGDIQAKDLVAPLSKFDELTDEEILYWSTPYGLELEAARKKEQEDIVSRKEDLHV